MIGTKTLIVLAATALITAGCGGSNSSDSASSGASSPAPSAVSPGDMPNDQAPPNRLDIDVDIKGGNVTPTNQQLKASVKQQIIIRVNSDAADELHVHSTPEHKFNVEAKPAQVFQFTVDVPGNVDVELHKLNKTIATIAVQ